MKPTKVLIANALVYLVLNNSYSQIGPGGVGASSDNALWLKADSNTSTVVSGQPISFWNDVSGNSNNPSQVNVSQQPLFVNSVIGYIFIQFNHTLSIEQNDFLWDSDAPNLYNKDIWEQQNIKMLISNNIHVFNLAENVYPSEGNTRNTQNLKNIKLSKILNMRLTITNDYHIII